MTVGADDNIWKLVTELMRAPAVTKLYHKCQFPLPAACWITELFFKVSYIALEPWIQQSLYYPATYSCVCCRVTVKITVLIMTSPYTLTIGFLLECPCPIQSFLKPEYGQALCMDAVSVLFHSAHTVNIILTRQQ